MRNHLRCAALQLLFCVSLKAAEPLKCPQPVTHIAVTQGEYSPQPGIVFELHDFAADMVSRGKSSPLCFLRTTEILHGDVFVTSASLSRLFQTKAKQSNSSISDLTIETQPDKVVFKGRVKKVISLPFTIEGPVTTDGRVLDVQAKSIKAMGIPVKGLLDAMGKELDSMIHSESVGGVSANGDTLVFQPNNISHVRGHIAKIEVTEKGLSVHFAEAPPEKTKKIQAQLISH